MKTREFEDATVDIEAVPFFEKTLITPVKKR